MTLEIVLAGLVGRERHLRRSTLGGLDLDLVVVQVLFLRDLRIGQLDRGGWISCGGAS